MLLSFKWSCRFLKSVFRVWFRIMSLSECFLIHTCCHAMSPRARQMGLDLSLSTVSGVRIISCGHGSHMINPEIFWLDDDGDDDDGDDDDDDDADDDDADDPCIHISTCQCIIIWS